MSEFNPAYHAIIPSPVRYDESLSPNAKLLYGELTALSNKEGYCWATNKYFSDLYKVKPNAVSEWVNQLRKAGHIRVEIDPKKGNKRKVYLSPGIVTPITKKRERSNPKKGEGSHEKTCSSNIENNTRVNEGIEGGPELFAPSQVSSTSRPTPRQVMDHWNTFMPKPFPRVASLSDDRVRSLSARLKDDYWVENWKEALSKMTFSPFLRGERPKKDGSPGKPFDFDFFIATGNVVRIMEKKYDDHRTSEPPKPLFDPADRYEEFIAGHPNEKLRETFPTYAHIPSGDHYCRSEFVRWKKDGLYNSNRWQDNT